MVVKCFAAFRVYTEGYIRIFPWLRNSRQCSVWLTKRLPYRYDNVVVKVRMAGTVVFLSRLASQSPVRSLDVALLICPDTSISPKIPWAAFRWFRSSSIHLHGWKNMIPRCDEDDERGKQLTRGDHFTFCFGFAISFLWSYAHAHSHENCRLGSRSIPKIVSKTNAFRSTYPKDACVLSCWP